MRTVVSSWDFVELMAWWLAIAACLVAIACFFRSQIRYRKSVRQFAANLGYEYHGRRIDDAELINTMRPFWIIGPLFNGAADYMECRAEDARFAFFASSVEMNGRTVLRANTLLVRFPKPVVLPIFSIARNIPLFASPWRGSDPPTRAEILEHVARGTQVWLVGNLSPSDRDRVLKWHQSLYLHERALRIESFIDRIVIFEFGPLSEPAEVQRWMAIAQSLARAFPAIHGRTVG